MSIIFSFLFAAILFGCKTADRQDSSASAAAGASQHSEVALAASKIINEKCAPCHSGIEADGGFDSADRLASLRSDRRLVVPGQPAESALLKRVVSGEMPPDEPLKPSETELIKKWIALGAPPVRDISSRKFYSLQDVYELILNDLSSISLSSSTKDIRYLSLMNFWNATDKDGIHLYDDAQIILYREAVNKVINSLSWNPKLSKTALVKGSSGSLLRVDLNDYNSTKFVGGRKTELGLQANHWERIGKSESMQIRLKGRVADEVRRALGSEYPIIAADYFTFSSTQAPFYNEILGIPADRQAGGERFIEQDLLGIDSSRNIKNYVTTELIRAGFLVSGVSRNASRLIERHNLGAGYYWKSYDFSGNSGRKNLFEHPVGPPSLSDFFRLPTFKHDGGEIIWSLPNGLQGYGLYDSTGRILAKAPVEIVSEPIRGEVVNGVSCMYCHSQGIIKKEDDLKLHISKNISRYPVSDFEFLNHTLKSPKDLSDKYDADIAKFKSAIKEIGLDPLAVDPITPLFEQYRTKSMADADVAARLFIPTELFNSLRIRSAKTTAFDVFNVEAARIRRDTVEQVFDTFVAEHKLEDPNRQDRYSSPPNVTVLDDVSESYAKTAYICFAEIIGSGGKNICGFSRVSENDAQRATLVECQNTISDDLAGFGFKCKVIKDQCRKVEDSDRPCYDNEN